MFMKPSPGASGSEIGWFSRHDRASAKSLLWTVVIAGSLVMALESASATTTAPGRFTMTPTDDGMLRLDTLTGAVTMCRKSTEEWKCEKVTGGEAVNPSDTRSRQGGTSRYGYEEKDFYSKDDAGNELKRLQRENRRLRALLASKGITAPPREKLELPSEEDVDKVIGFVERMIERFNGIVKKLQKEREEPGTPL